MPRHTSTPAERRRVLLLATLAAAFSLGHHIDHMVRGNHVGWPLTPEVNAFTISLGIYPTLATAAVLYLRGRIGPGAWALLSGNGALFVAALHFGPHAVEPPPDIVGMYPEPIGWFWFAWLVLFVAVLALTALIELRFWLRHRRHASGAGEPAGTA